MLRTSTPVAPVTTETTSDARGFAFTRFERIAATAEPVPPLGLDEALSSAMAPVSGRPR